MKVGIIRFLIIFSAISIVTIFFVQPIHQNPAYHNFADHRTVYKIPNFYNVFSNILFIVFGIWGLVVCFQKTTIPSSMKISCLFFFLGVFFTGIGSAYYHWLPNNDSLIWDRLPMTISFMSFFSVAITVFVNGVWGKKLLFPFLVMGLISIGYWKIAEDLRLYVIVQFLPIILLGVILIFSSQNRTIKKYFVWASVAYFIAKLFETYDKAIYCLCYEFISGHSLKHIAAALAPLFFIMFVKNYNYGREKL